MSGERNERSEKGNEEERRLTERTSEDEAQRNETPHTDQNTPKSKKSLQPIKRYFFVVPPTPKGAACFSFGFQRFT